MAKLTIGLPVYNGEKHTIRKSIESLLNQDFEDFELIICDNASTDNTAQICQDYAAKDKRVKYYRNELNVGSMENFFRAFELCTSEYFMWAADDDLHEKNFISACLKTLEPDSSIALVYPKTIQITDGKKAIARDHIRADHDSPVMRYVSLISEILLGNSCYGIYRTRFLRALRRIDDECRGPDLVLLAELSLYGKIIQIDEPLFISIRDGKWSQDYETQNANLYKMCNPKKNSRGITFPTCKMVNEHLQAIRHSPLANMEKSLLYKTTIEIMNNRYFNFMHHEIKRAVELVHQYRFSHNWGEQSDGSVQQLDSKMTFVYLFNASEILKRIEEVMFVCPRFTEPGLQYARAICLILLSRIGEAKAAIQMELSAHPDYERAANLLGQLTKGSII